MLFQTGGPPRYEHQKAGLKRLIETRGVCALLFDPGLGKTATTLDYLSLLALKLGTAPEPREARVLIAAPLAAVDTWVLEAPKWVSPQVGFWAESLGGSIEQRAYALAARGSRPFPPKGSRTVTRVDRLEGARRSRNWSSRTVDGRAGVPLTKMGDGPLLVVEVLNLDTFKSRQARGSGTMADLIVEAVKRFAPDVVVVDEMHKIKGVSSNVSRLVARVGALAPRRIGLTGTLMPHSPLDVYAQWRFLRPDAFGALRSDGSRASATFAGFRSRYAVMGGYMGREVKDFIRLDELQAIIAQNSIVARKEDALDLPPTSDAVLPVTLSPREQKAYDDMRKGLAASWGSSVDSSASATAANRLAQAMRLRQITAGHVRADDGTIVDLGSSKARAISSLIHDTLEGEQRVVVFALFRHEIDALRSHLERKGTRVDVITGDTPDAERRAIRERFGSDSPERIVLVAQVKTISLSVNELVSASHAVFASLSQQRDDIVQARDRLNRIGQTRHMTFWFAEVPGTIDTVIRQSYLNRTNLEAAVLAHVADSATR